MPEIEQWPYIFLTLNVWKPLWGSNRTNNIGGAEAGFGCPTMQYSNQDNFWTRPPPELSMAPSTGYYLFLIVMKKKKNQVIY